MALSLTPNALARMLEERPDPMEFQPVLQIAGEYFSVSRCTRFIFFFFLFLGSIFEKFRGERAKISLL